MKIFNMGDWVDLGDKKEDKSKVSKDQWFGSSSMSWAWCLGGVGSCGFGKLKVENIVDASATSPI